MTYQELRKLVAEMRHSQKEYFRTRSHTALEASKRLEKLVDRALADDGQKEMFDVA